MFGCVFIAAQYCVFNETTISGSDRFGAYTGVRQDFGIGRSTTGRRYIQVYDDWTSTHLEFTPPISLNWMSPASFTGSMSLNVPPDNDMQSIYGFKGKFSSYVTVIDERVYGFIDHTTWKTSFASVGLDGVRAVVGGPLHGHVVTSSSPRLASVRSLDAYARLCGTFEGSPEPPVKYRGWNSWAQTLLQPLTVSMLESASSTFEAGASIQRDAIYGLNVSDTVEWQTNVYEHGQSIGSYFAPFAAFSNETLVKCGGNEWNFDETILHSKGGPIHPLSNPKGYIRDATHPSTKCLMEQSFNAATLVTTYKVDFLNYAAYEGLFWNTSIATTGFQAYNYALYLLDTALPHGIRLDFGISPPVPAGPRAHSRHAGSDQLFGGVSYMMNQYRGGWFWSELFLQDPDLVTFVGNYVFRPILRGGMGPLARAAKAIIFSGVYKNGDDLSNATTRAFAEHYLNHTALNDLWRLDGYFNTPDGGSTWIRNSTVIIFNYGLHPINSTQHSPSTTGGRVCTDLFRGGEWFGVIPPKTAAILNCQ